MSEKLTERQIAEAFSKQVDGLLAGQAPRSDDPLVCLAGEMVAGPAMAPFPAFTQRLRGHLLQSLIQEHTPHRWWSFGGVAATLLLALALALVWQPGRPSVSEVLARAADAVAIAPGQITHVVSRLEIDECTAGPAEGYSATNEYWARAGTAPDGHITSVEMAGTIYAADDTDLSHPLIQHYSTRSRLCMRSLDPSIASIPPGTSGDDDGCAGVVAPVTSDSDPMAVYPGENFQDWISRMRTDVEDIEFHQDSFNDRPVYSLTYRAAGYQTQSPITVNHTTTGTIVGWGSGSAPTTVITYTVTLYIDRETYLPIGVVSKSPDPTMVFTQTILEYQVLEPTDLDFDPFTWPPER